MRVGKIEQLTFLPPPEKPQSCKMCKGTGAWLGDTCKKCKGTGVYVPVDPATSEWPDGF